MEHELKPSWDGGPGRVGWLHLLMVAAVIVALKATVLGWGVYSAHHGLLSSGDYKRNYHHHRIIERWDDPSRINFYELWVVSDAQWYNAIAEHGYPSRGEFDNGSPRRLPKLIAETDTELKYAFFPLWPLTIRAARTIIGDVDAAGFWAANILSTTALLVLYGFLAVRVGRDAGWWTVVLFASSPFGLFMDVPFSESLALLLAALTIVMTERGHWALVGLCVGLGAVTRPTGLALAVVPVVFIARRGWRGDGRLLDQLPRMASLLIAAIPPALLCWHNAVKTGDPFYFLQATDWWGYEEGSMWSNLWHNTVLKAMEFRQLPWHGFHHSKLDVLVLGLAAVVWLLGLRALPLHYSGYSLAVLMIPLLAKDDLMSFSRYSLLAWPLFLVPNLWFGPRLRRWAIGGLCGCGLVLQGLAMGQFVNWHWVG